MKGFIVGYFEEWSNDRNPIIVGYYTTWNKAIDVVIDQENINIKNYKGLREVYIVEIDVNKTYTNILSGSDWINSYKHYLVKNHSGESILISNKGVKQSLKKDNDGWQEIKKKNKKTKNL
jgi:hypothetical protein